MPNFGEVLLLESNDTIQEMRYIPKDLVPTRDEFVISLLDSNSSTDILINAFFDRSDFYINFPDEIPDAFINKSLQIQFFVQDSDSQLGQYKAEFKESPSWLSINEIDDKHFLIEGLPPPNSAGDYIIEVEVLHPNGLAVQTLKFNLKVNHQNQSRLDLLGSKILPVKSGLQIHDFDEPGYFAQNSFGEEITSEVIVSFPTDISEGKNVISYTTDNHIRSRFLLGHNDTPFVDFSENIINLEPVFFAEHRGVNKAFILDFTQSESGNSDTSTKDYYHIYTDELSDKQFELAKLLSSPLRCLEISDFKIGESLMWVSGLELNQLEETHTEGTHRCFIDCFDLNGEHLWQIDVIVDGQFDSTFLSPSNLDQILFYGRLTGNIEAGSFSFNCENPQWVGLLISSSGEVNTISPISSGNLQADVCVFLDDTWRFFMHGDDLQNQTDAEMISINKHGVVESESNFSDIQILQSKSFKDSIFVFGQNSNSSDIYQSSYFLGEIFSTGSFSWKTSLLAQSQNSEILNIQTFFDEYNRIQYAIEFKGSFEFQGNFFESSGGVDLLLLCISRLDGSLLWSDHLEGEGNDRLQFVFSNESGLNTIGLISESGVVFANQPIPLTGTGKVSALKLVSSNAPPSIVNQNDFEYEVENLVSHEIQINNSGLYKIFIKNRPEWLRLIENNGMYYILEAQKYKIISAFKTKLK